MGNKDGTGNGKQNPQKSDRRTKRTAEELAVDEFFVNWPKDKDNPEDGDDQ